MSILDQLTNEMKTAMKAGDKRRLNAIRLLISAIKYALVDEPEMNEEQVQAVLGREAKKRRESIEAYRLAKRDEQAEQEEYELMVIEEYLPKQLTEGEVRAKVQELLRGKSYPNFGVAMGALMQEFKGKTDGGVVAKIVKEEYKPND